MRVAAAAILLDGKIWTLPPPARHCHVIWLMGEELAPGDHGWHLPARADQGFVLDDGRFVSRRAAEGVARRSGQLKREPRSILTSEDLW